MPLTQAQADAMKTFRTVTLDALLTRLQLSGASAQRTAATAHLEAEKAAVVADRSEVVSGAVLALVTR